MLCLNPPIIQAREEDWNKEIKSSQGWKSGMDFFFCSINNSTLFVPLEHRCYVLARID